MGGDRTEESTKRPTRFNVAEPPHQTQGEKPKPSRGSEEKRVWRCEKCGKLGHDSAMLLGKSSVSSLPLCVQLNLRVKPFFLYS